MAFLLLVANVWAAVFSGPSEIKVSSEDVVVAWKNTTDAAVTVTAVRVDDAATLQVVPPKLPKTVEPGKSFKFLVVAEGTLVPGYVTVDTSAGVAKLWVHVSRAYIPAVAGGSGKPGTPTERSSAGSGGFAISSTIDGAEATSVGGPSGGFGGPDATLQLRGPLDERAAWRILQGHQEAFRRCAGAAAEDLVVQLMVGVDGRVTDVLVEGTPNPTCMENAVRAVEFPALPGEVAIRWEFTLSG